jgi:hypothetical protein
MFWHPSQGLDKGTQSTLNIITSSSYSFSNELRAPLYCSVSGFTQAPFWAQGISHLNEEFLLYSFKVIMLFIRSTKPGLTRMQLSAFHYLHIQSQNTT